MMNALAARGVTKLHTGCTSSSSGRKRITPSFQGHHLNRNGNGNERNTQLSIMYASDCTGSTESTTPSAFRELTGEDFWQVLKYEQPSNMLGVVLCYTSKCLPCKECKPIMEEWAKELDGKVRFYQFALTLPNKEVALGMDVRSSPTFLVFGRHGEILTRSKGRAGLEDIRTYIYAHCASKMS